MVGDGVAVDLPPDPAKKKQGIYPVPDGIRPKTEPHRVEVILHSHMNLCLLNCLMCRYNEVCIQVICTSNCMFLGQFRINSPS